MSNDKVRVRGISIFRPIIYGNTATLLTPEERKNGVNPPDHTHKWTVAVRSAASVTDSDIVGGADDLSYFIKRVTFKLHDTYANPTRNIDKPPFEVSETGWGEFEIQIRILFISEAGEKPMVLYHHLKLHPWTASGEPEIPPPEVALKMGPVHSWQYDEVVFNDPFQNFLNILTAHPPTPLPAFKKRPVPFHLANPASLEASKGGTPEFTRVMVLEEAARLEDAKKKVVAEQERWRNILIEKEKELEKLRRQLNN
ncbi:NuA4 histone H4 acetyltransferase complex and the SWR1 complex subunit [Marasmius tenuissimus]|uniref:Protein AF-9 homolog n=1 Tax=Marasmius tenuissimus TaxID=585030 RepID=A0ABR3A847_9AGAR|nr:NuA4 histone H4 acetyltransferase complex and the SWR1 complex subunit [Marasmius tenuissimus]